VKRDYVFYILDLSTRQMSPVRLMLYLLYCKKKCPPQKAIGKWVVTYGSLYMVADRQEDGKVLYLTVQSIQI